MMRFALRSLLAACGCAVGALAAPATFVAAAGAPATIQSCQYTTDNMHSYPFCSTGQTADVPVPSNAITTYTFAYPGDNSNITFTATLTPIDPTTVNGAGFTVFDTNSKATPPPPVEVVTISSNELNRDPHALQFNYSSGTPGPVTIQLFNYTPNTVTFSLNDSGFVSNSSSGSVTTPVTMQLGSAPPSATGPAPASPAPAVPVAAPAAPSTAGGAPATIQSCQYTSDNTHSYPYCSTGQLANVPVASNAIVTYKFNYPGDNSNITFSAFLSPVDSTTMNAMGFNVYDTLSKATPPPPVEIATISSNELNKDPHAMQFNYSSGTPGPVTLQLFNYSPHTVTFSLNDSGLVTTSSSGSVVTPVTLQLS
jgi:hypothetical protein